jgi:hypothetical protein
VDECKPLATVDPPMFAEFPGLAAPAGVTDGELAALLATAIAEEAVAGVGAGGGSKAVAYTRSHFSSTSALPSTV